MASTNTLSPKRPLLTTCLTMNMSTRLLNIGSKQLSLLRNEWKAHTH
jgi:hypothetical protein